MSKKIIFGILKYLDCFGTTFNFYIEKQRKFNTPLGGLLSILSITFAALIFTLINLDNFLHNLPNSSTIIERNNPRLIKFKEEKIWIPWRIRDFGGKTVSPKNLFYPIIYYYKGIWDDELNEMNISYELINYKLCNETSMVNNSNSFMIDIELDQLYCIDMEELDIGGSWNYEFFNWISFNIYACKNGIDYEKNNTDCTAYEKYIEYADENNYFDFEIYYPIIRYQPINKRNPFYIKYINNFYHFSRYSNKIDRIYLQQHILNDDRGWFLKKVKNYSSWGCSSFNGDSYANGNERDLMKEGSTSRFYSFNIFLESDIIHYKRSYKKIYLIIAEGLPVVNIIIIIFGIFAKIFKISSGNKKLTELLFENLKEKKTFMKVNQKKLVDKKISLIKKNHSQKSQNKSISINRNNNNDISTVQLTHYDSVNIIGNNNIINNINNNNRNNIFRSTNTHQITNKKYSKKIIKRTFFSFKDSNNIINNSNNNNINNKSIDASSNMPLNNVKKEYVLHNNRTTNNKMPTNHLLQTNSLVFSKNATSSNIKAKTHYIKKKLFPYKYYLCSIFIKNLDISKDSFFFTKKFIIVYNFICQLFDISSYLVLQREFQTMKNTVIEEKQKNIIEREQKINVNASTFNTNMKEFLNNKKLSIFGKLNQPKNFKY